MCKTLKVKSTRTRAPTDIYVLQPTDMSRRQVSAGMGTALLAVTEAGDRGAGPLAPRPLQPTPPAGKDERGQLCPKDFRLAAGRI